MKYEPLKSETKILCICILGVDFMLLFNHAQTKERLSFFHSYNPNVSITILEKTISTSPLMKKSSSCRFLA